MKEHKKKMAMIIVGILLSLGIIISVSYAWWSHIVSQEGINTIESTCLEIELTDENPIHLQNAYPITDAEAKILTPYTFTITNTCTTTVEYDVNLDIMESTSRLSSEYIAVEFNGETKKLLNTLESVETSYPGSDYTPVEARYLTSGELGANESKTYTMKLWMDESVTVEDDAMNKNFISKIVVTAKQSHKVRLVDYIMSDNETEEFTHEATSQTPALTDYRYTGANPHNYVCFGSEEETCPEENLYRIIGVIPTQEEVGKDKPYENRVKLVKATPYEENESGLYTAIGYAVNTAQNNDWTTASLNTEVLNRVYWNSLGEYQDYIASSVWYLGAITFSQNTRREYTVHNYYHLERGSITAYQGKEISYIANIGLMYISDWGYSINKKHWERFMPENQNILKEDSWLLLHGEKLEGRYFEWTIVPTKDRSHGTIDIGDIFLLENNGNINYTNANRAENVGTRPTFYLKSKVLYESGNGTKANPFRISINE